MSRLEALRRRVRSGAANQSEWNELADLWADGTIDDTDTELAEAAGAPEIGVIRNTETGLFWNNDTGWGSLATATEYHYYEQRHVNLPDEGEWADVNTAEDKDEQ